jgi:hypothetical protein
MANITLAFALGNRLAALGRKVSVSLDYVDTAPTPQQDVVIDGIVYQKSLRWSGKAVEFSNSFHEIIASLSRESGVSVVTRDQRTILQEPRAADGVRYLIRQRRELAALLSPRNGCIGLRAACPRQSCGLADKAGIRNEYWEDRIGFYCPAHGVHFVSTKEPLDMARLELNTPLRNLLRNYLFQSDTNTDWIQVVGADYAGFYQEQLLWRPFGAMQGWDRVPLILYSPQILDWSGAKLSKSLYVKGDAYHFLLEGGFGFALSYELYKSSGRTLRNLYDVCTDWVDHPYKLFRSYTIYHMDILLREASNLQVHARREPQMPVPDPIQSQKSAEGDKENAVEALPMGEIPSVSASTRVRGNEDTATLGHDAQPIVRTSFLQGSSRRRPEFHMNSTSSDWPSEDDGLGTCFP